MIGEVFGPVESRRLGYSLGINHLPHKVCSYSCMYCQLGRTPHMSIKILPYGDANQILRLTENRLVELSKAGHMPDTITLVPNGEPTLDLNIDVIIQKLKIFNIPIAVISNSSLMFLEERREALSNADIVSLKIDTVNQKIWKKINRPHGSLVLDKILEGMHIFAESFSGRLLTETMLVYDCNDEEADAQAIAPFLAALNPYSVYLSLPLRPPAEGSVFAPPGESLKSFMSILADHGLHVTLLGDLPETKMTAQSDKIDHLLNILKVHPLSEKEVLNLLAQDKISKDRFNHLLKSRVIIKETKRKNIFYRFNHNQLN